MRAALSCAVSLAWWTALAEPAYAFCRTTTVNPPSGYDPAEGGCWTEGSQVAWTAGRVGYALVSSASRQISLADATRVAHLAFGTWDAARCAGGAAPDIATYDDGPIVVDAGPGCGQSCAMQASAGRHAIVFDDDVWPHNDPANTLALTTITYGSGSGVILDVLVEINSHDQKLSAEEPPPAGTFDLQAIMTHEAGHFVGLAHATDMRSIMYAFYKPGAIALTQDDVDGLCAIYPPLPSGGCRCRVVGSAPGRSAGGSPSWASLPVGLAIVALWRVRRRRRASVREPS